MNIRPAGVAGELSGLGRLASRPSDGVPPTTLPRPRRRWLTRLLVPAGLFGGFAALGLYTAGASLRPATPVRVVPVVMRESATATVAADADGVPAASRAASGSVIAQASGWVEPDPYPIVVNALADGVVRDVRVMEGDRVEADAVIATLIDEDASLSLRRAEAAVQQAEATLRAARARWEHPVERTRAAAVAEAMVAQTEAELAKLASDVAVEAARAEELAIQFRQVESNHRSNAATETELATARQRLAAQQATLASAEAKRGVLSAQLASARAEAAAAREQATLRIDEAEQLAAAEATLAEAVAVRDEAALRWSRMTVRAPVAGVVLSRSVEPGSKLQLAADHHSSATVVRLYDPAKLQVRVDVPLADAARVGVGMAAEIVVSVLPERVFRGRVTRIAHEADVTRNTLQVKVAIEGPDPSLRPEMLARVRLFEQGVGPTTPVGATAPSARAAGARRVAVHAAASLLVAEGPATVAWVVDPGPGVARRRVVTLGTSRQAGWVEVASGLSPGDRLIVDAAGLRDGDRVRVIGEADASTSEGAGNAVH